MKIVKDIGEKVSKDELAAMIDEFDTDNNGKIDLMEFIDIVKDY